MPQPEVATLPEYAVLWPFASHDNNGVATVGDPVELAPPLGVKWERADRSQTGSEAQPIGKSTTVHVGREITLGSRMWLGKLVDLPDPLTNVHEVISYDEVRDIKGRNPQRTVTLTRVS